MKPIKWLGYAFAVGLIAWAIMGGCRGRGVAFTAPPAEKIAQLSGLSAARYREWLAANDHLPGKSRPYQLFIIQKVPNQNPLVLSTLHGEYDEETSGWPAPWPALAKMLEKSITVPVTVSGSIRDVEYHHRLIPVKPDAGIYLLINHWRERMPWWGWRSAAVAFAVAIFAWMFRLS